MPDRPQSVKNDGQNTKSGTRQDENVVLQSAELSPALRACFVEQRRASLTPARAVERLLGIFSDEARLKQENADLRAELANLRRQ